MRLPRLPKPKVPKPRIKKLGPKLRLKPVLRGLGHLVVIATVVVATSRADITVLACGHTSGEYCHFDPLGAMLQSYIVNVKWQLDNTAINCKSTPPVNCQDGIPPVVFSTYKPVTGLMLVFRAIVQVDGIDFTKVVNADGTWTITFNTPVDSGTVLLVYMTK